MSLESLEVATGPPTLFEVFRSEGDLTTTGPEYWTEMEDLVKEAHNRFKRNRLKKKAWIEAELAPS